MKTQHAILVTFAVTIAIALASLLAQDNQPRQEESELLVSLGVNNNDQVTESSGLAYSTFVEDSIWTLNDSGHSNELFLLKTDGTLQARVSINGATNVDWEAMAGFKIDGTAQLVLADVGDNLKRRKNYQLYLLPEPDLSMDLKPGVHLPIEKTVTATKIQFTYEDGPKNCEAIGVDVTGKLIWMVEKVYYGADRKTQPGIYALPLSRADNKQPMIAKRIADFLPRNVTGMDFSPDGKRLIIRNYLNAHLYARTGNETWISVVSKTKPETIVLPLQRQGEAICFSPDSESVIVTSEFKRQPIWQVNLKPTLRGKQIQE